MTETKLLMHLLQVYFQDVTFLLSKLPLARQTAQARNLFFSFVTLHVQLISKSFLSLPKITSYIHSFISLMTMITHFHAYHSDLLTGFHVPTLIPNPYNSFCIHFPEYSFIKGKKHSLIKVGLLPTNTLVS